METKQWILPRKEKRVKRACQRPSTKIVTKWVIMPENVQTRKRVREKILSCMSPPQQKLHIYKTKGSFRKFPSAKYDMQLTRTGYRSTISVPLTIYETRDY